MTNQQTSNGVRAWGRAAGLLALAMCAAILLSPRLSAAPDPKLKKLAEELINRPDYKGITPEPLQEHGVAGLRAVLDELFPEVQEDRAARTKKIASLIEQLGDASYEQREKATMALHQYGWLAEEQLRDALEHADLEVRSRARKLIADQKQAPAPPAKAADPQGRENTYRNLQKYLNNQRDVESRQEIARRVTAALDIRLDRSAKMKMIEVCLDAIANTLGDRGKDDLVQQEFLPLLQRKDPAPAMVVLRRNKGSSDYVTPLHKAAIASGRPDLVRVAFQSMTRPHWDEVNRPIIRAAMEKYFDGSEVAKELASDDNFLLQIAVDADRDFQIIKARQWLIAKLTNGQPDVSLLVLRTLGASDYIPKPMDAELLAAVETHLKSNDAKLRAAAATMLGMYEGRGIEPLLFQAFADPDKEVWTRAGESLHKQHLYYPPGKSPIPKQLERAQQTNADAGYKSRADALLKSLQQKQGATPWAN